MSKALKAVPIESKMKDFKDLVPLSRTLRKAAKRIQEQEGPKEQVDEVPAEEMRLYGREADLLMNEKIEEALQSLEMRLLADPDNLQTLTARNILRNALNKQVSAHVRRMLVIEAKDLLLNKNPEKTASLLGDIRGFNEFEMGVIETKAAANFKIKFASIEESIHKGELLDAATVIAEIMNDSDSRQEARGLLSKVFNLIKSRLEWDVENPDDALIRPATVVLAEQAEWINLINEAALVSLSYEEAEERRLDLSELSVDLPIDINRITTVENVPIVADVQGLFASKKVLKQHRMRHLVNRVYTMQVSMIGVPSTNNDVEEEFNRAYAFAYRKGIVLQRFPMRRPDSDATWFPIITLQDAVITSVGFPDMISRATSAQAEHERQQIIEAATAVRIRAHREAFEAQEAATYAKLKEAQTSVTDNRILVRELGEYFKDKFDLTRVSIGFLTSWYDKKREEELYGLTDSVLRWTIRNRITRHFEADLEKVHARESALEKVRQASKEVKLLLEEINNKKRKLLPSAKTRTLDRFAAMRVS